jgi:O-antigen/teichoic acid export membrane protein
MSDQPVTEPQKFAGYIMWSAASGLVLPLVGLVALPALTKIYSAAIYAVWTQSVIVVSLLSNTLCLCFSSAVVRFLAGESDIKVRRSALGAMLWPTLAFSCIVIIISLLFGPAISGLMFASTAFGYVVPLVFTWAALESIFLLLTSYLQARKSIKELSIMQICLALYKMAVIIVCAATGNGLEWIIGFIVVGEFIFVRVLLGMIVREIGWPLPATAGLNSYLSFSIPVIPAVILFWAIGASDRFFIVYLLNLSQAGVYSASFFLGNLIALFYGPIQFSLFPVVSGLWEQNEKTKVTNYLKHSNKLFLGISIPAAAGLFMLSQPLLCIMATPDYMAGSGLVLVIAIASVLMGLYVINAYVILLVRQTKWITPLIAVATATAVVGNLALIPMIGIIGAAVSVMLANLILAITATTWAGKVVGNVIDFKFLGKAVAGAILMASCVSVIHTGGLFGLIAMVVAGTIIFGLWMWLTRAFSAADIALAKDVISGLRREKLLK